MSVSHLVPDLGAARGDANPDRVSYLLASLGGGLGSVLRFAVNRAAMAVLGGGPFGTLLVNVVGS